MTSKGKGYANAWIYSSRWRKHSSVNPRWVLNSPTLTKARPTRHDNSGAASFGGGVFKFQSAELLGLISMAHGVKFGKVFGRPRGNSLANGLN